MNLKIVAAIRELQKLELGTEPLWVLSEIVKASWSGSLNIKCTDTTARLLSDILGFSVKSHNNTSLSTISW